MTNTEVEHFLNDWWIDSGKVFRYIREFMFDEYILVFKKSYEPAFVVDITSTYKLSDMNRDAISYKLRVGELVYSGEQKFGIDCKTMKTGGCECAAWIKPGSIHSDWCKLKR
jgi:hypothetical protein